MLALLLKCCLAKWKRFALFAVLSALLSFSAGLLGDYFLYGGGAVEPIKVLIADLDSSFESELIVSTLRDSEAYKDFFIFETVNGAAEFSATAATAAITIPQGFAEGIKNGANPPFSVIYNTLTPLRSALVKYFADALAQDLKTAQTGVYAALAYARENGTPEQYDRLFYSVNMSFLSAVMNRSGIFTVKDVSVTGSLSAFEYFFIWAYCIIMSAGTVMFYDIFKNAFGSGVVSRLRMAGVSTLKMLASSAASVFLVMGAVNIPFWIVCKAVGML